MEIIVHNANPCAGDHAIRSLVSGAQIFTKCGTPDYTALVDLATGAGDGKSKAIRRITADGKISLNSALARDEPQPVCDCPKLCGGPFYSAELCLTRPCQDHLTLSPSPN